jgi:hypothetical protein
LAAAFRGRQQVIVRIWISPKVGRSPGSLPWFINRWTDQFLEIEVFFQATHDLSPGLGLPSAGRLRQQLLLLSPEIIAISMLYRKPGNGSGIVKAIHSKGFGQGFVYVVSLDRLTGEMWKRPAQSGPSKLTSRV